MSNDLYIAKVLNTYCHISLYNSFSALHSQHPCIKGTCFLHPHQYRYYHSKNPFSICYVKPLYPIVILI